jgi:hypothetical protein
MKPQPEFLRIRWEETTEQGGAVTLEAMACLRHRREIALAYPSARGAGGRGEACDLCSGRHPRPLGSDLSQFAGPAWKRTNLAPSASMKPSSGPPRIGAEHRDPFPHLRCGEATSYFTWGISNPAVSPFRSSRVFLPRASTPCPSTSGGNARTTNRPVWKRGLGGLTSGRWRDVDPSPRKQ